MLCVTHWLFLQNLYILDSVASDYNVHTVCDSDLHLYSKRKLDKGSVTLLWYRHLDDFIIPLSIDDDHSVGIQFQITPQQYMFLFQVSLPCSNHSITVYREYMEKLYDMCNMYSPLDTVIYLGDFNAKIDISSRHSRDNILYNFLSDVNFVAANTLPCCRGATCSYVSYDNSELTTLTIIGP